MNRLPPTLRQALAVFCTATLAVVAACGGGGSTTSGSTAAPTSYSQGPISGFGSIIVNGVRWDDSAATVTDDDGVNHPASDLKLGMMVEVEGGDIDHAGGTGKAMLLRIASEMVGPIASVDAAASTFVVLGVTIEVTTSTVFDSTISGGIGGLNASDVVEVQGLYDAANNKIVATRVQPATAANDYRLRGVVSALDPIAKTFMLGTETIAYGSITGDASWLKNGLQVKVRMQTTQVNGAWVADTVRPIVRTLEDLAEAEVEGTITDFTSVTSFSVNGLAVDASGATLPADTSGIVLGAHVEVKGAVKDGVLVATSVKVDDDSRHDHPPRTFELHGAISNVNTTDKTFALRGLTVSYAGTVSYLNGTEADLVEGAKVEIKGTLATDLSHIDASLVMFEH
jgi:hypothetical protein